MQYKGYSATVRFDDVADVFQGELVGLRDVVTFEGRTTDELRSAFEESVDDYLKFCAEKGREPDKPYSGRFVVRLSPELHRKLDIAATKSGASINSLVNRAIENAVDVDRAK